MDQKRIAIAYFATGVIAGAIVASVLAYIAHSMKLAAQQILFDSEVTRPVHAMLIDVNTTIKGGNIERAKAKLALWEQRWDQYREGGDSPEEFAGEVESLVDVPAPK